MMWHSPVAVFAAIALSVIAVSPAVAESPVAIASVQGTGSSTPFDGESVVVQGVITADLPSFGGYFIQSEQSAATEGASDGIFIVGQKPQASVGDLVSVIGTAGESDGQTQVIATSARVLESAVGVPAATPLTDDVLGTPREAFEGMLVVPTGSYFLRSIDDPTGSLVISAGETVDAASTLSLDDGVATPVDAQPFLLPDTVIQPGDTLVAPELPMVLGEGADGYRLEPSQGLTAASDLALKPKFTADSPRLGAPPRLNP